MYRALTGARCPAAPAEGHGPRSARLRCAFPGLMLGLGGHLPHVGGLQGLTRRAGWLLLLQAAANISLVICPLLWKRLEERKHTGFRDGEGEVKVSGDVLPSCRDPAAEQRVA